MTASSASSSRRAGGQRRPAAVVFGGSDGGNGMIDAAAMLAARGYPALALACFGAPGLPSQLVNIPLEYSPGPCACSAARRTWIPRASR